MNTYSFLEVQAAIIGPGGVINLGAGAGVADEGISVDPTAEMNTMMVGADGSGQHSLHADKSGRLVVRLLEVFVDEKLENYSKKYTVFGNGSEGSIIDRRYVSKRNSRFFHNVYIV